MREKKEWEDFLACNPRPIPDIEKSMNEYLYQFEE
jgi:hypothetical protein